MYGAFQILRRLIFEIFLPLPPFDSSFIDAIYSGIFNKRTGTLVILTNIPTSKPLLGPVGLFCMKICSKFKLLFKPFKGDRTIFQQ